MYFISIVHLQYEKFASKLSREQGKLSVMNVSWLFLYDSLCHLDPSCEFKNVFRFPCVPAAGMRE
jgi:hypothetical protein